MKRAIQTFTSHEEADAFARREDMAMTPAERVALCCQISFQGWKLHNPEKPLLSVRESGHVEVHKLGDHE